MEKVIKVLEVKNKSLRVLIGYLYENNIKVICSKKFSLSIPLNDGDVLDVGILSNDILNAMTAIKKEVGIQYNIDDIILVLPPYGLGVYRVKKVTNTIDSTNSGINHIDVKNVNSLIEKENVPNSNVIVSIIPNYFFTEDEKRYEKAPLGVNSNILSLDANVYTLPFKMVDDIKRAVLNANLKINKTFVNTICVANYLKNSKFKDNTFIYIDVGSKNTTLSVINEFKVCACNFINIGLDNLVDSLTDEFGIDSNKAIEIRNVFGLDNSNHTYKPIICKSIKESNEVIVNSENLYVVVNNFINEWIAYLSNCIKSLMSENQDYIDTISLVFNGNGLRLNGLKDRILKNFIRNNVYFLEDNVIGANISDYASLLGAITLNEDLEDNYREIIKKPNSSVLNNLTRTGGNRNE